MQSLRFRKIYRQFLGGMLCEEACTSALIMAVVGSGAVVEFAEERANRDDGIE